MIIDCHVHISAFTHGHGHMSERLLKSLAFRFMRIRLGIWGTDESTERAIETRLVQTIDQTPEIDAAVVLAFDAVYDRDGRPDPSRTHIHVTNDYVIEVVARHPGKMLLGCSVNPYRKDAVAELERCVKAGAVLMKWLPVTQAFNPADDRCIPLYDAMAHHKLPLLCHTGYEQALPILDIATADPTLLELPLERGVTVIAAHCATGSLPWQKDYLPKFVRLAHEYEHFYGDTAALNLPTRWHAYASLLNDQTVRNKLVHGSDWPILPIPSPRRVGFFESFRLMLEPNWMRRDVLIKRKMGFDDAYWHRAAKILRIAEKNEPPGKP